MSFVALSVVLKLCETMDSRKSALLTILRNRRNNAQDVWEPGDAVSVRGEDILWQWEAVRSASVVLVPALENVKLVAAEGVW